MTRVRKHTPIETYGLETSDLGPVLEVQEGRGQVGEARLTMDVGYWGIVITLSGADTVRLRDQLTGIIGDGEPIPEGLS